MKPSKSSVESESLQRAIHLLNEALTRAKTKQKASKLLREWPDEFDLYGIISELPAKMEREAKMELLYKALINCCLSHKVCWDHIPSYSMCMSAWRKQFMKFKRQEKEPRGLLG